MELKTDKMLAEKSDGIGWMTFNNPARRNATSLEMWEAIDVILKDFEADDKVRVIVMKGAGGKAKAAERGARAGAAGVWTNPEVAGFAPEPR